MLHTVTGHHNCATVIPDIDDHNLDFLTKPTYCYSHVNIDSYS